MYYDASHYVALRWDVTTDPCNIGYRVFASTTATTSSPPGSFPNDPPFNDITGVDFDSDNTNENFVHNPSEWLLFYIVIDERFDGSWGLAGHYGG
jgi:hypothetical protein